MKRKDLEAARAANRAERKHQDALFEELDNVIAVREENKNIVSKLLEEDSKLQQHVDLDDDTSLTELRKRRNYISKQISSIEQELKGLSKDRIRIENDLAKSDARLILIEKRYGAARGDVQDWIGKIDAEFQREARGSEQPTLLQRVFGKGSIGVQSGQAPDQKKRPMQRIKRALALKIAPQFALMIGVLVLADNLSGVNAMSGEGSSLSQGKAIDYLTSTGNLGPNTRELLALSGVEAISDGSGNHIFVATDNKADVPGISAVALSKVLLTLSTLEGIDHNEAKQVFENYMARTVLATIDQCRASEKCSGGSREIVAEIFQYQDDYGNDVQLAWNNRGGLTLEGATPGWENEIAGQSQEVANLARK